MSGYRVAVVCWTARDEIAEAIASALVELGHEPVLFAATGTVPVNVDVVFSFAPYGRFLPIVQQLACMPSDARPVLIHWNTEGIPDINLPWSLVYPVSTLRSWLGRATANGGTAAWMGGRPPLTWLNTRMLRYRYVGDYYYAYQRGVLNIFADSSVIYADIHRRHGLPTTYFPWGYVPEWSADTGTERDVDVLWLGKRGSRRRSDLLDSVRHQLRQHAVNVYVADNVEHPYLFREERTAMLNRTKITLNITRTWYDDNFSRFSMAGANRSLIVSEPMLPHCPEFRAGVHYVSAPIEQLSNAILYYLEHEDERRSITDAAYLLLTQRLTLANSVAKVLSQVEAVRHVAKCGGEMA